MSSTTGSEDFEHVSHLSEKEGVEVEAQRQADMSLPMDLEQVIGTVYETLDRLTAQMAFATKGSDVGRHHAKIPPFDGHGMDGQGHGRPFARGHHGHSHHNRPAFHPGQCRSSIPCQPFVDGKQYGNGLHYPKGPEQRHHGHHRLDMMHGHHPGGPHSRGPFHNMDARNGGHHGRDDFCRPKHRMGSDRGHKEPHRHRDMGVMHHMGRRGRAESFPLDHSHHCGRAMLRA